MPCQDDPDRLDFAHQDGLQEASGSDTKQASSGALTNPPSDEQERLEALAEEARAHRDAAGEGNDALNTETVEALAASSHRRSRAPAEGERNAMVGYIGQYDFAAVLTLQALRDGTLQSVRLADVHAGQVDDFVLLSADRVDAHQVKWSRHPGSVGGAGFVRSTKDRTSFIRQLADGWVKLRMLHAPRRVVVYFVTNDLPSREANDSIPRGTVEKSTPASFAAFLAEAWFPAVEAACAGSCPISAVPEPWVLAMTQFSEASGLEPEEWRNFLADCRLRFGAPSLEASIEATPVSDAERAVLRDDAHRLAHTYMSLVARPDRRIEFSRDQLLDLLGWRYRAEFRNAHEFPDPEIPYRSIAATVEEFGSAVERFSSGYLALVGSPGSGKSTLLTRTLRGSPHRVLRYYAYVRGAVGGNLRRGEAVNFFHDISILLDRAGFRVGAALPVDDLDLLTQRVHKQLLLVQTDWQTRGHRTVVLVDGLDHIPREQRPAHSLLSHLPHPEDVPEGVLFVLGTQTDRLADISQRIRDQLDEQGRRITIRPIDRKDVLEIVETADGVVPAPSPAERERVFELCGGHPLALNYIINRLRDASGVDVEDTLASIEPFRETIDRQYATIWGSAEDDIELARLLALLARARGQVRLDWLRLWAPAQALHTVTTRLAYLFRREHGGRWAFFHNSFRAFLIGRTRGIPALGSDSELFAALAEHCSTSGSDAPEHADEIYYRAQAGESQQVLSLLDPASLRRQFVAGRSATMILEDLAFARDAAVDLRDIAALTLVVLCSAEFSQRDYYTRRLPVAETFLELGEVESALTSLREGDSLRTSSEAAINAAAELDELDLTAEAREVFLLAEPLDVLFGAAKRIDRAGEAVKVLDAWIAVAPRFRTVPALLDMIERVQVTADEVRQRDEPDQATAQAEEVKHRQSRLLQRLAMSLDSLERWDDADQIRLRLRSQEVQLGWWFWTQSRAWHDALLAGEHPRARTRFAALRSAHESGEFDVDEFQPIQQIALASGYIRVDGDTEAARSLIEEIGQPPPVNAATAGFGEGWNLFFERFALNRVLGALGDERPLSEVIPDLPREPEGQRSQFSEGSALVRQFERGVASLARLVGARWTERRLEVSDFEKHVRLLLRLFPDQPHLLKGSYLALGARNEFYSELVRVAASHGREFVDSLRHMFEIEWADDTRRSVWPDPLVRTILRELLSAGSPPEWVRAWLGHIEPKTFRGDELESELSDGISQVRAWAAAGDMVRARATLERTLRATSAVEAKDDQLSSWLSWAVRANEEDPTLMPERLRQIATAIYSLDGSEAQGWVAPRLIEAGVEAGAHPAMAILEWALRNGTSQWVDGLSILIDGFVGKVPEIAAALSALFRCLVLPFARTANVDLVAHLGAALRDAGDTDELSALSDAIEVDALGSTRSPIRSALAGDAEVDPDQLRDEDVVDSIAESTVVDAFEGLSLTLRELQARVRNVQDIEDLAKRLKPRAYTHRWEQILSPFLAEATTNELVVAAAAIPQNEHAWRALSTIAERLIELGDPQASKVAAGVLECSRAAGWSPHYDGGSRLRAYELLIRISPEAGRNAAWVALQHDLRAGEVRPRDLFAGWDRLVEMLAPGTTAVCIWEVIARHVEALAPSVPEGDALDLPAAEDVSESQKAAEIVYNFAGTYLDHHAYALAQGAQQFYTDRLVAGDPVAEASLATRLANSDLPNGGALLVLRAVALVRGSVPQVMQESLRALCQAPSFADRRAALALIGQRQAVDVGDRSRIRAPGRIERPLPTVFSLVHPPAPDREGRLPGRGEMLEPAADAADLVSAFRSELDLIATWADVQPEALYRYVADTASTFPPAADRDYSFDEEPVLRDELRLLGLKVGYYRPRQRRVERAMAEATAMLVDHGRIGEKYLPVLERLFRNADPYFLVTRPTRRPSTVAPIRERTTSKYVETGWTEAARVEDAVTGRATCTATNSADSPSQARAESRAPGAAHNEAAETVPAAEAMEGGWVVLAEETWVRWLDWKQATETRVGARLELRGPSPITTEKSPSETACPDDHDGEVASAQALIAYIADFSHLSADEYLTQARAQHSVVVRSSTYRFTTSPGRWLAINPALAEQVGWRPAADGLFRWLDGDGEIVAESVWWRDGFVQQRPPLFDDEVGHGWLVRVTAHGWRTLSGAIGECVDWRRISRLAQEQPPKVLIEWTPVLTP